MTDCDAILQAASIKIAEAQRQRDKARRELSRARQLLREMQHVHSADIESYEEEDAPALKAWAKVDRFLAKRDNGRRPKGRDVKQARCEARQSGPKASPRSYHDPRH